jgi:hypothetical protein
MKCTWSSLRHGNIRAMTTAARIGSVAAALAALLAAVATLTSLPVVASAAPDVVVVEAWRMVGLAMSTALLALLALRPTQTPALWWIMLGSKLALVVVGLTVVADAPGARDLVLWDGVLVVLLAIGVGTTSISPRGPDGVIGSARQAVP